MKRPEKDEGNELLNLPLASREAFFVELPELQTREEELYRGARVTIRPRENHTHAKLIHDRLRFGAPVVRCVVPEEDGVLPPPWRVSVKCLRDLVQEERDDIAVGCRVAECEPGPALRIERSNHRQSWRYGLKGGVAHAVAPRPTSAKEARFVEPGLVDVDDASLFSQEQEQGLGELLPLHERPISVGLRMRLLGLYEAQGQVLLQRLPDEPGAD